MKGRDKKQEAGSRKELGFLAPFSLLLDPFALSLSLRWSVSDEAIASAFSCSERPEQALLQGDCHASLRYARNDNLFFKFSNFPSGETSCSTLA